jgi:hypothetical protein
MIDLEPVKLPNLKNQKKTAHNKLSINDFQNLLQEKTTQIKPQLAQSVNLDTACLADSTEKLKSELFKRAKGVIQKLELLKLQILNCSSLSQCIKELELNLEALESQEESCDDTLTQIIIRAKVEIAKYKDGL